MDEQTTQREAMRLLRGSILRLLAQTFVTSSKAQALDSIRRHCQHVRRADRRDVAEALAYLEEASVAMVRRIQDQVDHLDRDPAIFYELTARGYRVYTGVETDASVIL